MPRISPGEYEGGYSDAEIPAQRAFAPQVPMISPEAFGQVRAHLAEVTKTVIRQGRLMQILSDGDEYKKAVEQLEAEERAKAGLDPRVDGLERNVIQLAEQFSQFINEFPRMVGKAVAANLEQYQANPVPMTEPESEPDVVIPKSRLGRMKNSTAARVPEAMNKPAAPASSDNGKSTVVADGMEREIH